MLTIYTLKNTLVFGTLLATYITREIKYFNFNGGIMKIINCTKYDTPDAYATDRTSICKVIQTDLYNGRKDVKACSNYYCNFIQKESR